VRDTRYYSDGGVDVVLRCPLEGGLASALAPAGARESLPEAGAPAHTGLIIDASGVDAEPVLLPTLVGPDGTTLVGPRALSAEALRARGGLVYVRSLGEAEAHPRAGERPLRVDVSGIDPKRGWRLDTEEAAKLEGQDLGFVRDGKVVVVLAAKEGSP
jgi:hypothetical protein